jgi:hypothetical protein
MTLIANNNQHGMSRYGPLSSTGKKLRGGSLPDRLTLYQNSNRNMRRSVAPLAGGGYGGLTQRKQTPLKGGSLKSNLRKVGATVSGQITRQRVKKICEILDTGLKGTSYDKPVTKSKAVKAVKAVKVSKAKKPKKRKTKK